MTGTPGGLAFLITAAPESESRLTISRTLTPSLIIWSAMVCELGLVALRVLDVGLDAGGVERRLEAAAVRGLPAGRGRRSGRITPTLPPAAALVAAGARGGRAGGGRRRGAARAATGSQAQEARPCSRRRAQRNACACFGPSWGPIGPPDPTASRSRGRPTSGAPAAAPRGYVVPGNIFRPGDAGKARSGNAVVTVRNGRGACE